MTKYTDRQILERSRAEFDHLLDQMQAAREAGQPFALDGYAARLRVILSCQFQEAGLNQGYPAGFGGLDGWQRQYEAAVAAQPCPSCHGAQWVVAGGFKMRKCGECQKEAA